VVQVTNLVRTMERVKEEGLWLVGLDLEAETPLFEADLGRPLALVVGNEQTGLRPLVKKACDLLARIPPAGPIQSLNAATSAAVAMAEIQRQRFRA
jgi:23S rRNA (guanosine2251-2'-O)-methyltransferase